MNKKSSTKLTLQLGKRPRASLAQLPTPLHQLTNFSRQFDDQEIWIKRDDLTGLEGGGNKTDPVYEAKAVRGLLSLAKDGYFQAGSKILLMHLGGSPAIHAYANQFDSPDLRPFP